MGIMGEVKGKGRKKLRQIFNMVIYSGLNGKMNSTKEWCMQMHMRTFKFLF